MDILTKTPNEIWPLLFNFSHDLLAGETLVSKTVVCVNAATGVDSAATIVDSSVISGLDVAVVVKAGTEDDEHHIECTVVTSGGNTYQRDCYLRIQTIVTDNFSKQPSEVAVFEVDFSNRLAVAETIDLATATAIKESDGADSSAGVSLPLIAVIGAPAIVSPLVGIPYLAGLDGFTYLITLLGTTSLGYIHQKTIRMNVQEH